MILTFETLGNATIQFCVDGSPVLVTDPWLVGTCYFGSWALDHPLSKQQISNAQNAEFIWISHGHPDHLHHESLHLLPKGKTVLLPDHYDRDIETFLTSEGFSVQILEYRKWYRLHPQLEILCLDNENQDAILIARFGEALVINLNDSPFYGERPFLRKLVRNHPNDKVYVLQLCSIDADMRNFVDELGQRTIDPPEKLKPGAVWSAARGAALLGAKYFCCSSSQHIYVRADSVWANPYRITYSDLAKHWSRPEVQLVPPFVTMEVNTGTYLENHPSHESDTSQISDKCGDDDWSERLSPDEWQKVEDFFQRFRLLRRYVTFIDITVGDETRRIATGSKMPAPSAHANGIAFAVPRRSLLETVTYGYFDDLLIGNFMKTRLYGKATLYPFVTPIIAKLGGNAKVFDSPQYLKFCWRYWSRSPLVFIRWRLQRWVKFGVEPLVRAVAHRLGLFQFLKNLYRTRILNDPHASASPGNESATTQQPELANKARGQEGFGDAKALARHARFLRSKWTPECPDFSHHDRPLLIVSVDTEEDFDWGAPFSAKAKAVHSMSRQYLAQNILERYGVKPIYLCDFPIADQEAAYSVLREWHQAGRCAIGAQLHAWVNPPFEEIVNERNSFPCNLPLSLQQAKLRILTDRLTETMGVRPTVYKAGRHGVSPALPELLKPLRYKVDMSVNPIRDYRSKGGPDHTQYPHTPFWFDVEQELLALPLTANVMGALQREWLMLSDLVWNDVSQRLKFTSLLRRLHLINRIALTPEGVPLEEAKQLTNFLIRRNHRVFVLSYHSPSLTPGSTPYVRSETDLRHFLDWLDAYLEFFIGTLGGVPVLPMDLYAEARRSIVTEPAAA